MSRPIGAIVPETEVAFIDREAMMMDGGRLFFQLTPEDSGGAGGDIDTLPVGTLIQDQQGNIWEVTATRAAKLVSGDIKGSRFRRFDSIIRSVGRFFQTETGRSIELSPDGTFRRLTEGETNTLFPQPAAGTRAPAFSSTQAAQTQAEAFAAGESAKDREEAGRLQQLRLENARRLEAISSLRTLAGQAAQIRQRFRTDLLGLEQASQVILAQTLGQDPIRGAILEQGGVQRGTTPSQAFRANVSTVGQQAGTQAGELATSLPTPDFGADIEGLEAQIKQFTEALNPGDLPTLPTAPIFGLEHGGEVVKAGKDEPPVRPFTSRPDPMTAFRFAEQMGLTPLITGEREGGPELVLAAKGTQVIPLDDREEALLVGRVQGAQEGFFEEFDFSTIEQALSPVFENLGFGATPITQSNQQPGTFNFGTEESPLTGNLDVLNRLGVQPRLIRFGTDPTVFFRDPSGTLRRFSGLAQFQEGDFNFSDVVNVSPDRRDSFTFGDALTEPPPLIEPGVSERRFPLRSRPLTVDFPEGPDIRLPAARQLASIFRTLGADTRAVILSAFGVAGQGRESFLEELSFFTPKGRATTAGAAAFG